MNDIITRRSMLAGTATAALAGSVAAVAASPKGSAGIMRWMS